MVAFSPNDVHDSYRSKNVLDDKSTPLEFEKKGLVIHLKHFLAQNSYAYNYLGLTLPKHAPSLANVLMKLGWLSYQPVDDAGGAVQLHCLVFEKKYGLEWAKAWDVTRILISELKKEVENCGCNLAVVSIPFREQVYENL